MGLVYKLWELDSIGFTNGCSKYQVMATETLLDMKLPDEFIEYAETFGRVEFANRKWAGIGVGEAYNVASITLDEKKINPDFPEKHFILESLSDVHKIIVDELGMVYDYKNKEKTLLSFNLSAYIDRILGETA